MDGLNVGETVNVRASKTLDEINYTPLVFWGSDRMGDYRVEDVKILEDDETGEQQIKITWEGDLTKRLGRKWDHHNEPVTESEKKQAKRKRWLGRIGQAAALVIPVVASMAIGIHVTQTLAEKMTVNGEPLPAPAVADIAPLVVIVALVAGIIHIGLKGGFPGMVGGLRD
jgi:hypothetical protein